MDKRQILKVITPIYTFLFIVLFFVAYNNEKANAAKLVDGTWTQSGTPGTTTIVFTNVTALDISDTIVLTFPSTEAPINATGTDISVTGQTTPIRTNDAGDNTITITLDTAIGGSTSITITMTDGLTSYTTTNFAMQSAAINTNDSTGSPHDFGVALITNDNTTTVTASVPLFVTMAIDDTTMDLGTLSVFSVNEVDQTYTVNSNNHTGITMQIATDGNLRDGNGNDIDYVADSTVTAGSEEYGISVDNVTGLTIDPTYQSGDNAIVQAADDLAYSSAPVSSATLDINYKASISGFTVAGSYSHVVTVTIATNA